VNVSSGAPVGSPGGEMRSGCKVVDDETAECSAFESQSHNSKGGEDDEDGGAGLAGVSNGGIDGGVSESAKEDV